MELKNDIKKLTSVFGVSGDEYEASQLACEMLAPYVDTCEVDEFGNVIGRKSCGRPGAKKLLLDAHIDQIGFFITQITDEGFLKFSGYGAFPGMELVIKSREGKLVPGVVATIPPHLQQPEDSAHALADHEMVIDIGMTGERAKQTVNVGDRATFAKEMIDLAGDAICGKAMDDRACFVSILYTLELLKDEQLNVDLVVLGSTREEIGLLGAANVACSEAPDYAIAIDVTHARTGDAPQVSNELGKGPVIAIGPNSLPEVAKIVMEIARAKQIPYQVSAAGARTGTNAGSMQVAGRGVRTLVMSLPLKYMHSPVEVMRVCDAENLGKLVAEFARQFDGEVSL